MTVYNSRKLFYKNPFGAVEAGTEITFRIVTPPNLFICSASLMVETPQGSVDAVTMEFEAGSPEGNRFTCRYTPQTSGCCYYEFFLSTEQGDRFIHCGENGQGKFNNAPNRKKFQLTVYNQWFYTPDSWKGGILYQIFPDRFAFSGIFHPGVPADRKLRSDWGATPVFLPDEHGEIRNDDYFCGDLEGIRQKLGYIQQLGVTSIYLNPIFEAHSNHRYNTADYRKVDPLLGNEDDFARLCADAEKHGIRIILDGVFSHTGSDSIYFNRNKRYGDGGAYNTPESPYFRWYRFQNYPTQYDSWWGIDTLPAVDELYPDYLSFICGEGGVIDYWMNLGASGFRLDVADELPDGFIDQVRKAVKRHGEDKLLIGEVWEDASNKISYGVKRRYLLGDQLDSVMNYPFKDAVLSYVKSGFGSIFKNNIMTIVENYPKPALDVAMNSLSTHDTARALTVLSFYNYEGKDRTWQAAQALSPRHYLEAVEKLKLAMALQFFLPGIPCIYYGDEAGMQGFTDPFNRGCYPWGHPHADLLDFTRKLSAMRKKSRAVAKGTLRFLHCSDRHCAILRQDGEAYTLLLVNRDSSEWNYTLPEEFRKGEALAGTLHGAHLHVPAIGFAVLNKATEK